VGAAEQRHYMMGSAYEGMSDVEVSQKSCYDFLAALGAKLVRLTLVHRCAFPAHGAAHNKFCLDAGLGRLSDIEGL